MLKLVLPKGSLEKATLELFDAADLSVSRSSEVDYKAAIDDPRIDEVRILRPQEIPSYVADGLFDLGITTMKLMTNNPAKLGGLEGFGLEIVERVPLQIEPNPHNEHYLRTKRERMGHLLDGFADDPIEAPPKADEDQDHVA